MLAVTPIGDEGRTGDEMNLTLSLDKDQLQAATVQAIVGQLTPEAMKGLIEQAVVSLLKTSDNFGRGGITPIEQAFNQAVAQVAREAAVKYVSETPELQQQLRELVERACQKLLKSDPDKYADRLADAFATSIRERY